MHNYWVPLLRFLRYRSVSGLSLDFQLLNFLGFACYTAYNVCLFYVPSIREEYQQLYSGLSLIHI